MMSRACLSVLLRRVHMSTFLETPSAVLNQTLSGSASATMAYNSSVEPSSSPNLVALTPVNSESLAQSGAQLLHSGGVIAIPTDTVYGLAADAQNNDAVTRLYEIKGRDFKKPIAICLSQISQLHQWAHITVPEQLLEDFLPGPVTLVFKRSPALNPRLNPSTDLIGIRIPRHDFVCQLAAAHGGPVALTSANPSAAPSTVSVEEFRSLWPFLDCIFDGGNVSAEKEAADRAGSTVIDLSQKGFFRIIRPGTAYETSTQVLREKYCLQEKFQE